MEPLSRCPHCGREKTALLYKAFEPKRLRKYRMVCAACAWCTRPAFTERSACGIRNGNGGG